MEKNTILTGVLMAADLACAATVRYDGALVMDEADAQTAFVPAVCDLSWNTLSAKGDFMALETRGEAIPFRISVGDAMLSGTALYRADGAGGVCAKYEIVADRDCEVNTLCVLAELDGARYFGGKAFADGREISMPREPGVAALQSGVCKTLKVVAATGGGELEIVRDAPGYTLLQDNRRWNVPTLTIRLGIGGNKLAAGEKYALGFTVRAGKPLALRPFSGPVKLAASEDWVPMREYPDIVPGSPLDFSGISGIDAPAGKYGRVVAHGENFEFEKKPGVPQRFYGVNFCFSANYLSADEAERLATRLARIGYNAIRIHHYESMLTEGSPDGTTLNDKRVAEFDNLVAACIRHGLYVTTDLFVSRRVPWRAIGEDRDGVIGMDEFKRLVPVHGGAFSNLCAFSRNLLAHVNPHTGRSYAEEPALAWISLINEDNPGNHGGAPYSSSEFWVPVWKKWLADRKAAEPEKFAGIPDEIPGDLWARNRATSAFSLFLMERECAMASAMKAFLRDELHCGALVTDMNSWMNPVSYQVPRAELFDYVDDHFYVDHPRFLEKPWCLPSSCPNSNPFIGANRGAQGVVFTRVAGKPFTITEYNYSGPGRYRGVGGIATGTMAALQDWAGVWRFAWSHSHEGCVEPDKAKMGYFDIAGDPLSLAAERASVCLFLRRDLAPHERNCVLWVPPSEIRGFSGIDPNLKPDYAWLGWLCRLGTVVSEAEPTGFFRTAKFTDRPRKVPDDVVAALMEGARQPVAIDAGKGVFTIDTPCTDGGFAETGKIEAGALVADVGGVPATIWASSLDGCPLGESESILVTHLTDVQNTGIKYADGDLKVLLDWGRLPHLMRAAKAEVALGLDAKAEYKVEALSADGRVKREILVRRDGAKIIFQADVAADREEATYLYHVKRVGVARD